MRFLTRWVRIHLVKKTVQKTPFRLSYWRYLKSVLLVLAATMFSIPIHYVIQPENLVMLYLAAVILAALFLGKGPAILASILSVITFDFFLVEPRFSFTVQDTQYLLTFLGLLTVGIIISNTIAQLRSQVDIIRQREAHTAALNSLSQELTGAKNLDEVLHSIIEHIRQSFNCRVTLWLADGDNLRLAADSAWGSQGDSVAADPQEIASAHRFFRSQLEGKGTADVETRVSPPSPFFYLPLRAGKKILGILGLETGENARFLSDAPQRSLLQGFSNLAALAIERDQLAEQARQAQLLKDVERLQTALLNSISHELRTPLVSITGALSALAESGPEWPSSRVDLAVRRELIETAYEESRRLNLLVGNLLDMSRLESGALHLNLEPCDLQDLAGIALERFAQQQRERLIRTSIEEDLPLIMIDVTLMVEVLVNLLVNADKYSPKNFPLELTFRQVQDNIEIEVSDKGPGVSDDDLEHIFDKFYRSTNIRHISGLGLGLSISKGIVEVHGGKIFAQNRAGGGLTIKIHLPVNEMEAQNE